MKILFAAIFLFSSIISAQSILHPDKSGFGYHYSHSIDVNIKSGTHTIYYSNGRMDLYFAFSNIEIPSGPFSNGSNIKSTGFGVTFNSIKEGRILIPSLSIFVASVGSISELSLGPAVAVRLFNDKNFSVIPQAGAAISFIGIGEGTVISKTSLGLFAEVNLSLKIEDKAIITFAPGWSKSDSNSFFSFSLGISVTPF